MLVLSQGNTSSQNEDRYGEGTMYVTVKELADRWGVSEAWVTRLCKHGRIPGATKNGKCWYIPADAQKPADGRKEKSSGFRSEW